MSEGDLEALTNAVKARRGNKLPLPAELAECRNRLKDEQPLECRNGKRSDRPQCLKDAGSQNIDVYAHAGLGHWTWIAAVCRQEREEGDFGRERGAPGGFYYSGIVDVKCDALKHLEGQERENVRLAIRSNLAWDAICSVPVTIVSDSTIEAGKLRYGKGDARKQPRFTACVSGNRWTDEERPSTTNAGMIAENAHSATMCEALINPEKYGLSDDEVAILGRCIRGDAEAARVVASWMHGTIDTPDNKWRFRLRRTMLGAESVYFGPWPSPYKPPCAVCQVTLAGERTVVKASPRGVKNNAVTDWRVDIEDGVIIARCTLGESRIAELGGEVLWQIDVSGSKVDFR